LPLAQALTTWDLVACLGVLLGLLQDISDLAIDYFFFGDFLFLGLGTFLVLVLEHGKVCVCWLYLTGVAISGSGAAAKSRAVTILHQGSYQLFGYT
jgi:hypothetical protein